MSKKRANSITVSVRFIVMLIAILLVAGIVVVAILANQSLLSKPSEMKFDARTQYLYTGTGFMYTQGGVLKYDDLTDTDETYSGNLPHPDVKLAGYGRNTHAVYDASSLCIVGLKDAIAPGGEIKSVECGNGFVACLTEKDGAERITVYGTDGELKEEIIPDNTVTEFGFTHLDKEQLYMITLDTDAGAIISTVTTYDPSAPAMTGIITVQNQLVENILFTKKSVFVEGTTNMIRYDANNNTESYRLITRGYHMGDSYVKGDKVYFAMHSDESTKRSVRMYVTSQSAVPSEEVLPVQVPADALGVFVFDKNIYALTSTDVYMYDSEGELCETEKLQFAIDGVQKLDGKLLLVSGGRAYTVTVTGTNKIKSALKK